MDNLNDVLIGDWAPGGKPFTLRRHWLASTPGVMPRLGADVTATGKEITLRHSHPGTVSLYYGNCGRTLFFSESKMHLRRTLKTMGVRGGVSSLDSGETVTFDGDAYDIRREPFPLPDIRSDIGEEEALDEWWDRFLNATYEMHRDHGGGPVTVAASGGTDSLMALVALKEIGADVLAMSCGLTRDNFDPHWAQAISNHLGVPFEFMQLPVAEEDQARLMLEALRVVGDVGCADNIHMAMSCWLMQRRCADLGRSTIYLGFRADSFIGNKMGAVGIYNKVAEAERTDQTWQAARAAISTGVIPYLEQVNGNFRMPGFRWRVPFFHPEVLGYTMSLPRRLVPPYHGRKVFFEKALNRYLPEGLRPWDVSAKVAFNSGSGFYQAAKAQGDAGPLGKDGIRSTLRRVRTEFGL